MKIQTKDKIFDVALDLFSKKGYDSVSIRTIASEVGIKESSIYNHYSSKKEILMSILKYFEEYFQNTFEKIIFGESWEEALMMSLTICEEKSGGTDSYI